MYKAHESNDKRSIHHHTNHFILLWYYIAQESNNNLSIHLSIKGKFSQNYTKWDRHKNVQNSQVRYNLQDTKELLWILDVRIYSTLLFCVLSSFLFFDVLAKLAFFLHLLFIVHFWKGLKRKIRKTKLSYYSFFL